MDIGCDRAAEISDSIWRVPGEHGHARTVLRRSLLPLVLGAAVKMLTNPVVVRMIAVALASGFAFVMGLSLMRRLRRGFTKDEFVDTRNSSSESFPLQAFHRVIQELKQQKHELQSLQQQERRRARTSENISAAVLSSISCGVIFFTSNGIVRQANAVARQMLGFASLAGMGAAEIFREATLGWDGSGSKLTQTLAG